MTRNDFIGKLPKFSSGINIGRLNRKLAAKSVGLTVSELSKAYNNWIQIFRMPGSNLTFEQYLKKMQKAGIRPRDIGNRITQYQLSRFNDEGPYTKTSCRFLKKSQNLKEQKRINPYLATVKKYGRKRAHEMLSIAGGTRH